MLSSPGHGAVIFKSQEDRFFAAKTSSGKRVITAHVEI
jgi:hypothetical protein